MKTSILLIITLLSTIPTAADTYVWEDYDDFSGTSLDSTKWGIITFNGGIEPYHQDGSLILSSNGQDLNAVSQNESEWNELVADYKQWGDPEVFYVIRDTDIVGVEASILMPAGTINGTFFDLSFHEVDSSGQELTSRGIGIGLSQENGNTKIVMESEGETFTEDPISANLGQMYSVSIIRRGDMCSIFLNEEQVGQISFFNFQPNLISLSAYNEDKQGFAVEADNVRVLRRANATTVDGSVLILSSTDGVSETLSFENGTFTSTFIDPEEGSMVNANQTYILDQNSDNNFKITLSDGDTYKFDSKSNSGTLVDYENGVVDESGSWNFSFIRHDWKDYDDFSSGSLDSSKWDLAKWDGGEFPVLEGGKLKFTGQPNSSSSVNVATSAMLAISSDASVGDPTSQSPHSILEFKESQNLEGIELTFSIPSGVPNQMGFGLYAVNYQAMFNSQSDSEEESAVSFNLDLWADNSLAATLEFDAKVPITGVEQGIDKSISFDSSYRVSFIRGDSQISFYMNGELIGEFPYSDVGEHFIVRAMNEINQPFTTYLDNVRVLRRSSGSPSIKVAPLALSAFRDKVSLQGQNGPVEIDGASEINFDLQLTGQPAVSAATMTVDSVTYDLASFQAPTAFRTNYGYSSFDDELFDVESSSESDWDPYINGKTFNFNITVDGITYSYAHNLPAESSLPNTPNTSFVESLGWKTDSDGFEYQEARTGNSVTLTWETFSLASSDDFITVSVEELVGDNEIEVMGSTSLPVTATSYEFPSSLFESGKKYILYVAFHKVLESENPTGFEHQTGTNTSQPLLITTARAVTAVDVVIVDTTPVTVVSDPNGQAVVVQLGDEYKWNSTMDGVTLWSVSGGDWYALTAKFSGGKLIYGFEFADDVSDTGANSVTYEIDANGYIKSLEGDGDYQYYNVVSVENGVIGTIQNDQGVESVADNGINQVDQWFFTTRAAAEEYYYSKVNPKSWMWFDHYPWVYSNEEQDWLYFHPSGGTLMYWSNKGQAWRQFN
jgi:hypothetical protein